VATSWACTAQAPATEPATPTVPSATSGGAQAASLPAPPASVPPRWLSRFTPEPELTAPDAALGTASSSTEPTWIEEPLQIEFQTSNRHEVMPRGDERRNEYLRDVRIAVHSDPPQRLFIGRVREGNCHLTYAANDPRDFAGLFCYENAVGFRVWLERRSSSVVIVRAHEGYEFGPTVRAWQVGVLVVPSGRPVRLSFINEGTASGDIAFEAP